MKGALQPDLSITGTATSRHERPNSGGRRRPPSASMGGSTKANIYGVSDTPRNQGPSSTSAAANGSVSHYTTPENPRPEARRSQEQAQSKSHSIAKDHYHYMAYQDQPVDVVVHPSPGKGKGRRPAPMGVPQLQLGNLADYNNKLERGLGPEPPHVHTPDTARSDVSWGTPVNSTRLVADTKQRGGKSQANDNCQVRTQVMATSQHKRPMGMPALDLQHSQEEQDLKRAVRAVQYEKQVADKIGVEIGHHPSGVMAEQHNRPWSTQPTNEREMIQQKAREEQEKLYADKKKDIIMETVLVDQLSRATVSDPEAVASPTYTPNIGAKERKQMEFYNTRSVQSPSKSENLLAKRVRFGARLVTKNGHDVHRELNGFFFSADNTLTVYEFRQFGTRSSALPFIQRCSYTHLHGKRKGQQYTLHDIAVGNSMSFVTSNQSSLPQSISAKPVVTFRITDVDEEAKERLTYDGCSSPLERRAVSEKLNQPLGEQEMTEKQLLLQVQGEVRKQLQRRAVKTMMGLGKHFRLLDKSGDGMLDKGELIEALRTFHIQLPTQFFEELWHVIDANGDGVLDYGEFVRGFIGEMNETRKTYVRKVFHKLDPSKTGVVELNIVKKFFSAKKHPKVLSGEMKEYEAESTFLDSFQNCETRGEVTYAEFEDYYEGVSIAITSDQEFVAMMKNCWGC